MPGPVDSIHGSLPIGQLRVLESVAGIFRQPTSSGRPSEHRFSRFGPNLRKPRIDMGKKFADVRYLGFELSDRSN